MDEQYYVSRKSELLERFDEDVQIWRQALADHYSDDFARATVRESREAFERLILDIPYIGGDENHLTGSLVRSARCLAFYKAMKARGKTAAETGKVLYDAAVRQAAHPAPPIPPSEWLSPEELMQRRRERARKSQDRRYPEDYVYEFVEGDGETFDYGYDFVECATHKFCHAQGADEFTPFFCFLDFPLCQAAGLGLARTMTLAEGHEKCNHRFRIGGKMEQEWPPSFLENE